MAMLSTILVVLVSTTVSDITVGFPALEFVAPVFEPLVILSLGVPLYLVTMAGQNVPGFAVLRVMGYRDLPVRAILAGTGIMTAVCSLFGGHAVNLSAITAAMVAGPDAHPDRGERWVAAVSGGLTYVVLGLSASAATALVVAAPEGVIATAAGLALIGALGTAITTSLADPQFRLTASVTFLTVVSGISLAGVSSAFWGLVTGFLVMFWVDLKGQVRPKDSGLEGGTRNAIPTT